MFHLWKLGYSAEDIITNIFRVCKSHTMAEFMKLEFIKECQIEKNLMICLNQWLYVLVSEFLWSDVSENLATKKACIIHNEGANATLLKTAFRVKQNLI